MAEPTSGADERKTSAGKLHDKPWARTGGLTLLLGGEAIALVAFVSRLNGPQSALAGWAALFLLGAAVVVVGLCAAARQERLVERPLRRLNALLPELRSGEAAIEELNTVGGKLAPLASELQTLFREVRQMRADEAAETRQRVASRTSALERKLGSLQQQASRDVLTGLFNRRVFEGQLSTAVIRCRRERRPMTLLMVDVDNFKVLNDTLGHTAGDEFLRALGQIIRSTIRGDDTAFRWGGDEFAILLEGADQTAGQATADRLTSLVDSLSKNYRVPKKPGVSVGVAAMGDDADESTLSIVHAADRLLYEVKARRKKAAAASEMK